MKNLLIGNGINIQYGGKNYTNKEIIKRAIHNTRTRDINPDLYAIEILQLFEIMFKEFNNIINGKYDAFALNNIEKSSLINFKKRYAKIYKNLKIYDVGFEDHFLIFELFCRKNNVKNPELYDFRGLLKRFILDSIFNDGEIQNLHKLFPLKLKTFFNNFNNIFTTNYDKNLEIFIEKTIIHLHGAFNVLDDVYNPDSFRNKLSDNPASETPVVKGYEYLFSNALISFSGKSKSNSVKNPSRANAGITKFAEGIKNNLSFHKKIEAWSKSDNNILKNLGEAILLKDNDSSLSLNDYYSFKEFENMKGTLSIIGLSPFNDDHLFSKINCNREIKSLNYYYFSNTEINSVSNLLKDKKDVSFINVESLWSDLK